MNKAYSVKFASLLMLLACAFPLTATAGEQEYRDFAARGTSEFPSPSGLRPAVNFWRQVFGVWRCNQVVLHDNEHLSIVYEVIDLPGAVGSKLTPRQREFIVERRRRLENRLRELEYKVSQGELLTPLQQQLLTAITQAAEKAALAGASTRLRSQRGMRERFHQGMAISGRYEALFRQIFKEAGLPEGLAYLPHVESSFINHAHSSAGAAGVWQFLRSTGRLFLVINSAVDERYDPVLAARGAARYLKKAYEHLGDWGLAITAYNYGIGAMRHAKQQFGTDIEKIAHHYKGRRFGFASRNFYAEFLAVQSIITDLDRHFPEGVQFHPPMANERIRLTRSVSLTRLASLYGIAPHVLAKLNPALLPKAVKGHVALPAGTEIWLPQEAVVNAAAEAYVQRQDKFKL